LDSTAIKERPIIMSRTESVQATLDGTKTQTRRIVKCPKWDWPDDAPVERQQDFLSGTDMVWPQKNGSFVFGRGASIDDHAEPYCDPIRPRYQAGDRLWVREPFAFGRGYDADSKQGLQRLPASKVPHGVSVAFPADGPLPAWAGKPRPSIFMPRWASRIDLEVLAVHVERLQKISPADCRAEGVRQIVTTEGCPPGKAKPLVCLSGDMGTLLVKGERKSCLEAYTEDDYWRHWFAVGWDELHGKGAWWRNDWVWAITYRRVKP
jgi:hypothetical protein